MKSYNFRHLTLEKVHDLRSALNVSNCDYRQKFKASKAISLMVCPTMMLYYLGSGSLGIADRFLISRQLILLEPMELQSLSAESSTPLLSLHSHFFTSSLRLLTWAFLAWSGTLHPWEQAWALE